LFLLTLNYLLILHAGSLSGMGLITDLSAFYITHSRAAEINNSYENNVYILSRKIQSVNNYIKYQNKLVVKAFVVTLIIFR